MPPINEIIRCYDLASCFQAVYNLGLVVLFVLAFLNMVYGAIEYLFSAGSFTSKESGKNRIINSIGAIAVVLILPQILNIINPGIFQVKLKIPKIEKASAPEFEGEAPWLEIGTLEIPNSTVPTGVYYWISPEKAGALLPYLCFGSGIIVSSTDTRFGVITSYPEYGVSMNSYVYDKIKNCLEPQFKNFVISQGYNPNSFDLSHQKGIAIDIYPTNGDYHGLASSLSSCGFTILNESEKPIYCPNQGMIQPCPEKCKVSGNYRPPGCPCAYTGAHLHAILEIKKP